MDWGNASLQACDLDIYVPVGVVVTFQRAQVYYDGSPHYTAMYPSIRIDLQIDTLSVNNVIERSPFSWYDCSIKAIQ